MSFLKKIIFLLINSKIIFRSPPKKKILIYDKSLSRNLIKYLPKQKIEILDTRFLLEENNRFNLYIFLKIFTKLKININEYINEYIKAVEPKIILTHCCQDTKFYALKKFFPKIKFIAIQHGKRTEEDHDIFSKENIYKLKKLDLKCDYLFIHNNKIGKMYQSICQSKIYSIGSFDSNSEKIKKSKRHKFLLISNLRVQRSLTKYPKLKKDFEFYNLLSKFVLKNGIKVTVLGAHLDPNLKKVEFMIFKKIFKNNLKFIPRDEKRQTYKILDNAEMVVNIDSTAGYEAASRGTKVAFFATKGNIYPYNSLKFGWPIKKKNKGLFWTSDLKYSEIERIIKNLKKLSSFDFKRIVKKELKNIMVFKPGNNQFKETINKILNKN